MNRSSLTAAMSVEWLKMRRSKVLLVSGFATLMFPLVGGLFMFILKNPDLARQMGLIAAKAQLTAGTADWPSYFGLLAQMLAAGGFFVFALVLVWCFGREYVNSTAKDLLALPMPREAIVVAKLAVTALWSLLLAAAMLALAVVAGAVVGLPGWSAALASASLVRLAVASVLTILLVWPFALAASAGRGYLPPFGFMLLSLALAQILGTLGYGAYFPWAVPAFYAMGVAEVGAVSFALVVLVGLAGVAGTVLWWRYADQT
jgi:ABC-2 type transport system permease protein